MALPQLTAPKYELILPSTKEKIKYRPFLVKEQKILLIAYESQDKTQILNSIMDVIQSCVDSDVDIRKFTTFDVDYIFSQIRAKSVGEKIDLTIKCEECGVANNVQVNLEDIQLEVGKSEKIVKLTDDISVKLKYPSYFDFMDKFDEESETDMIMEILISCIDSIMTEEENIMLKNEPREEVMKFIESMNSQQFEQITEFVQSLPAMTQDVEFNCVGCGHENKKVLRGLDDFF